MLRASCVRAAAARKVGPFRLSFPAPHVCKVSFEGSKLNLLGDATFTAFHHVFANVVTEEMGSDVRAVVLTAPETHNFCAGLDLKGAMGMLVGDATAASKAKLAVSSTLGLGTRGVLVEGRGMPAMRAQKLHRVIRRYQDAVSSIARCRVPVIAASHRHCIGGGVNLISAADMRYGTRASSYCLKEAKIGITADIGALQRLPAIVGMGNAREMAFTARTYSAEEALRMGLISRLFDTHAEMLDAALAAATEIAANGPLAVQGCKEVMNHASERTAQDSLDHVRLWNTAFIRSDDLVAAGMAFASKGRADFTDYVVPNASTQPKALPTEPERTE